MIEEDCAGVVFAETSVLSGDAKQLAAARRTIAGIAYKRDGGGCASPHIPSEEELRNPTTKSIWEKCQEAAKLALKDDVKSCKHFVIWYSDDKGTSPSRKPKEIQSKWPYDHQDKISSSWGPFSMPFAPTFFPLALNVVQVWQLSGGGPDNIYVMQYCGVP